MTVLKNKRRIALMLVMLAVLAGVYFFASPGENSPVIDLPTDTYPDIETLSTLPVEVNTLDRDGSYYLLEDVALYIHLYEQLPPNYITKSEARALGWDSQAGNLWEVAPGCVIGGDRFGNNEGLLPEAEGRDYYECDVNYDGGYRDEERIVYSDDGLIFYTADHYESFTQLYE